MKYVGRQSDPKDVASLNPSVATDTTLDGSESIGGWKGGFVRTTVAKICAWIVGQANTWTAAQRFNSGLLADSVSTTGSGALDLLHTAIFLNKRGSADRYAHIDLFAAAGAATYNARVLRNPGSNGTLELINTGSGGVSLSGDGGAFAATLPIYARAGVQLGELSPTFKVKVIDTTMAATVGDVKTVAHGVGAMPIMVIPRVTDTGGVAVHPNSIFTNAQYGVSFDATNVYLRNATGASANIVSRPVSIVIFYTA